MSSTQEVGEIFGEGYGPAHAMLRSPTVLIAAVGLWANEELERHTNYYANTKDTDNSTSNNTILTDDSMRSVPEECTTDNDDNDSNDTNSEFINNINTSPQKAIAQLKMTNANNNNNKKLLQVFTRSNNNGSAPTVHSATSSTSNANKKSAPIRSLSTSDLPPILSATSSFDYDDNAVDVEASIMESVTDVISNDKMSLLGSMQEPPSPLASSSKGGNNGNANSGTHPNDSITWYRLVALSMSLLLVLHGTYYTWIDILHRGTLGAVYCFYITVTIFILLPFKTTIWVRKAAKIVIVRILELITCRCWCFRINEQTVKRPSGPRAIPFVDVFFADALCSLSKVFFDWGMLLHMAYYYPKPVPPSSNNILIPSAFAAIPYFIRARQCLVMYAITRIKNDPSRNQHLWNALKYCSSIFPLLLSAYQKTVRPTKADQLESYLIMLLIINALFSLYWDIVMDWGMMKNPSAAVATITTCGPGTITNSCFSASGYKPVPTSVTSSALVVASTNGGIGGSATVRPKSCWYILLRQRLRFGIVMSLMILLTDCVLRFSWTLRFYHKIFPSGDSFVLCTQFLEIFRRAIWNLLRVEWENIKQTTAAAVPTSPAASQSLNHNNAPSSGHVHPQHLAVHSNLISRHNNGNGTSTNTNTISNNSTGIIELSSMNGVDSSIHHHNHHHTKDDDNEKVKLLLGSRPTSTNIMHHHHIIASNKVKP